MKMYYQEGKEALVTHLMRESQRGGQGRFLLPPCHMDEVRRRAEVLKQCLPAYPEAFARRHLEWPWASVRILVRRFHTPVVSGVKEPEGSNDDSGTVKLTLNLRMGLGLRTYLELLLPPDHPNSGIWTGISPRDLEWGKSTRTVLSDKKETMSREGLFPRGRRPV